MALPHWKRASRLPLIRVSKETDSMGKELEETNQNVPFKSGCLWCFNFRSFIIISIIDHGEHTDWALHVFHVRKAPTFIVRLQDLLFPCQQRLLLNNYRILLGTLIYHKCKRTLSFRPCWEMGATPALKSFQVIVKWITRRHHGIRDRSLNRTCVWEIWLTFLDLKFIHLQNGHKT